MEKKTIELIEKYAKEITQGNYKNAITFLREMNSSPFLAPFIIRYLNIAVEASQNISTDEMSKYVAKGSGTIPISIIIKYRPLEIPIDVIIEKVRFKKILDELLGLAKAWIKSKKQAEIVKLNRSILSEKQFKELQMALDTEFTEFKPYHKINNIEKIEKQKKVMTLLKNLLQKSAIKRKPSARTVRRWFNENKLY